MIAITKKEKNQKKTISLSLFIILLFTSFTTLTSIPSLPLQNNPTPSIRINEIMYNPAGADSDHEWIELHNTQPTPLDITGWKLYENGVNHGLTLQQGTMNLPPQSYAVIADDYQEFLNDYPTYTGTLIDSAFSLLNTGEYLAIKNTTLHIIDELTYQPQDGANDTDKTIEYVDINLWKVSLTPGGTPGQPNSHTTTPPQKILTVTKNIWNGTAWVNNISTLVNTTLKFNITLQNTGNSSNLIYNINITDTLPLELIYTNNATLNGENREPDYINNNQLIWDITPTELYLQLGQQASLEFTAFINQTAQTYNHVNVTAEYCDPNIDYVYDEAIANITALTSNLTADAHGPYHGTINKPITINGTATGGLPPYNYSWDLNNDTLYNDAYGPQITHTWTTTGTFPIHLKVTDYLNIIAYNHTTAHITTQPQPLTVTKTIWNGTAWATNITKLIGTTIRFNITIQHTGTNNTIYNIDITDTLPLELSYNYDATLNGHRREADIINNNLLIWKIKPWETYLKPGEKLFLEFTTQLTQEGTTTNNVNVTTQYTDPDITHLYQEATAHITIQPPRNELPQQQTKQPIYVSWF